MTRLEQLKNLETHGGSIEEWLEMAAKLFNEEYGSVDIYWTQKGLRKFVFITGGWYWNEEIIRHMEKNRFMWTLSWWSSRRGGRTVFKYMPTPDQRENLWPPSLDDFYKKRVDTALKVM
jgi:hypothetical protein